MVKRQFESFSSGRRSNKKRSTVRVSKPSFRRGRKKETGPHEVRKDSGPRLERPLRKRPAPKPTRLRPVSFDEEKTASRLTEEPDFSLPVTDTAESTVVDPKHRLKELEEALRSGIQPASETEAMRINRYLAYCGLGSRREVEKLVVERRVQVNGRILDDLGYRVQPNDLVSVDGRSVRPARSRVYIGLNKPRGYVVSRRSFPGNPSIYELLPAEHGNLGYAGRLDRESRGLVILSSDGAFIQSIAHPRQGVTKRYIVTVDSPVDDADLTIMTGRGVKDEGEVLRAISARVINRKEKKVEIVLGEGRNRQIRRMFEALKYQVVDLFRVSVGKLTLDKHPVKEGEFFTFSPDELLSGEGTSDKDVLKGFHPWKE